MENNARLTMSQFETLNKIIADLYDDALPLHNRIINFLYAMMGVVWFDRGTVLFFRKNEHAGYYEKHSSISINWEKDEDFVKKYNSYYCHVDDTLPVMDSPYPVIFKSSTFFNQEQRKETEYWKDYLLPNNCIYSIEGNLQLNNPSGLLGGFAFYRGAEKSDFTDMDTAIIQLFQVHLSHVLKKYGDMTDSSNLLFMFENYNCVGVCLLNSNYEVLRSNSTFQRLQENKGPDILNKAINLCYDLKKDKTNKKSEEYKFDNAPIFLEVSRIPEQTGNEDAQFCILTYDLSHVMMHTLNRAKEKYVLTPREFEIVKAVLRGKKNEEIASELFLSLPTVKKYLASIYSKMEIKNQKQIFEKLKLL